MGRGRTCSCHPGRDVSAASGLRGFQPRRPSAPVRRQVLRRQARPEASTAGDRDGGDPPSRSPFEAPLGRGEREGRARVECADSRRPPSRPAERRLCPPPLPFDVTKASRPSRTLPLARRRSAGPRDRLRLQPRRGSRGQPPQLGNPLAPPVPSRGRRGGGLSPGTEAASPPHSADQDDRAEAPSRRRPDPASCPGHGALPLSRRALPSGGRFPASPLGVREALPPLSQRVDSPR